MKRLGPDARHLALLALFLGAGGGVALLAPPERAVAEEQPIEIVATTVRQHGYACEKPKSVERDEEASLPDEPVWIIVCENGTYRVRYMGSGNPKVRPLSE